VKRPNWSFDNSKIPDANRLGGVGKALCSSMKILEWRKEIPIGSVLSLGKLLKGAYEAALKYSKERVQFGSLLVNFKAIFL